MSSFYSGDRGHFIRPQTPFRGCHQMTVWSSTTSIHSFQTIIVGMVQPMPDLMARSSTAMSWMLNSQHALLGGSGNSVPLSALCMDSAEATVALLTAPRPEIARRARKTLGILPFAHCAVLNPDAPIRRSDRSQKPSVCLRPLGETPARRAQVDNTCGRFHQDRSDPPDASAKILDYRSSRPGFRLV